MEVNLDNAHHHHEDIHKVEHHLLASRITHNHEHDDHGAACTDKDEKNYLRKTIIYLITFFLILIVFPTIAITIIIVDDFKASVGSIIGLILLIITYITVIVCLAYILTKTNALNLKSYQDRSSETKRSGGGGSFLETIKANLYIYTLIAILGLGDCVFDLVIAADEVIHIINKEYKSDFDFAYKFVVILEEVINAVNHLNILLFIVYHKDYTRIIISSVKIKYFIGLISVSSLLQWIFIIFREIRHEYLHTHLINETDLYENNTVHDSGKFKLLEKYQAFLFPLGIEFRISCFIELALIALTTSHEPDLRCQKKTIKAKFLKLEAFVISIINKLYWTTSYLMDKIQVKHKTIVKTFRHLLIEQVIAFNVTTITIIVICAGIVVLLFQDVNAKTNEAVVFEINEFCKMIVITLTMIYTIFLFLSVTKRSELKSEDDLEEHANSLQLEKKIDFLILHVSNVAHITFCILTAVGGIKSLIWLPNSALDNGYDYGYDTQNNIPMHSRYITIIGSFLPCVQSTMQVLIIWLCANKINVNKNYLKTLIVFNFTLWIFETFSTAKYQRTVLQSLAYGAKQWKILTAVFLPMSIFYRFHSCLMIIKIKANKYLTDEHDE